MYSHWQSTFGKGEWPLSSRQGLDKAQNKAAAAAAAAQKITTVKKMSQWLKKFVMGQLRRNLHF